MMRLMTVKDTLVDALRDEGYDFWTASEHASRFIAEFLTSGQKEMFVNTNKKRFLLRRNDT